MIFEGRFRLDDGTTVAVVRTLDGNVRRLELVDGDTCVRLGPFTPRDLETIRKALELCGPSVPPRPAIV